MTSSKNIQKLLARYMRDNPEFLTGFSKRNTNRVNSGKHIAWVIGNGGTKVIGTGTNTSDRQSCKMVAHGQLPCIHAEMDAIMSASRALNIRQQHMLDGRCFEECKKGGQAKVVQA